MLYYYPHLFLVFLRPSFVGKADTFSRFNFLYLYFFRRVGRLFLFPTRQSVYSANFLIFRLAYSAEREDFFFSQFGNRYRVRTFLFFDSHTPPSGKTFFVLFQMPGWNTFRYVESYVELTMFAKFEIK